MMQSIIDLFPFSIISWNNYQDSKSQSLDPSLRFDFIKNHLSTFQNRIKSIFPQVNVVIVTAKSISNLEQHF